MRWQSFQTTITASLTLVLLTLTLPSRVRAAEYTVLYQFPGGTSGGFPAAGLLLDMAGNLYGTTVYGGAPTCRLGGQCGVVFKLTANPDGSWSESVLYSFTGWDGAYPSGLIFDSDGNLYGTTGEGGGNGCYERGCGTVFKLTPKPDGSWKRSQVHLFNDTDGTYPANDLIFDTAGNLYGTTTGGGDLSCAHPYGCGVVFKLKHKPDGRWKSNRLHAFSRKTDGVSPYGGVIFDAAGNLYGTTFSGGIGYGTVFKLTPEPDGKHWKKSQLYAFQQTDGNNPLGNLTFDAAGNLYGTTVYGGDPTCVPYGCGVVFTLAHTPEGIWTESTLHAFKNTDGAYPEADLIADAAGNIYGTASGGGDLSCVTTYGCGVVFKLTLKPDGSWKMVQLHRFNGTDGDQPFGGLTFDAAGNLYGTTYTGGTGEGVIFRITP